MQLGQWDVEVDGQDYVVSVERGESGKDAIRVNGRVAAKPMGPDEPARTINVGGWPYVLRRVNADQYDLQVGEGEAPKSPAALARDIHARDSAVTAMGIVAKSDAPVSMQKDSFFKRLPGAGWIVIILAVAGLLYMASGPSYDKIAFARVNRVLSEMHSEKTSQFAVTFWYKNKKVLDNTEMSIASGTFDKWRMEKGLYRQIGDYSVLDSKVADGEKVPTAIVRFLIEGKEYHVRVAKDLPISWEE